MAKEMNPFQKKINTFALNQIKHFYEKISNLSVTLVVCPSVGF